jgi:hypothetical protein
VLTAPRARVSFADYVKEAIAGPKVQAVAHKTADLAATTAHRTQELAEQAANEVKGIAKSA